METIDVIVPVHRGLAATRRCLDSLLAAGSQASFAAIVVDDATPEPEIAAYLDGLAADGRITLLRNGHNVGFVHSVNRGMALHEDRDVVLLNSDSEVANDWLDRLRRCIHGQPDVGTATPFSSNATICTYPFDGWPGGVPGTLGLAALDQIFAVANAGACIDLPTGVGSCLYIRRACLNQVGAFDAERFGRGYGEENDFCLRALEAGWRSVLAGDVFVYHEGAVSFAGERAERIDDATAVLLARHPDYRRRVLDFVARDPARPLREAVDAARLERGRLEAASVLGERAQEYRRLTARLVEVEALAAETIASLRAGLAHAEELVARREPEFNLLRTEIDKLRVGLSQAERLAISRLEELQRIHASLLWKLLSPWLRTKK